MKKLLQIAIIALASFQLFAGDVARKGTTGAEQLLIPVGARGISTGGALLASMTGLEAVYYNPAGLDLGPGTEAMFSYMSYLADINVSYFAASAKLGDLGSVALSFKTLDFGEIPVTTADYPDGTGRTYSPGFLTLGLTYSKVITDRISIGTNLKLVSESIENTTATGYAIDFGVQYRFSNRLFIGAAVKNIGSNMEYSGAELQAQTPIPIADPGTLPGTYQIVAEGFQIPSYFELSAGYNYQFNEQNNLLLGSTFTANNSLEDKLNFGLEYGFMNIFFLRGGYNLLLGSDSDNQVFGFTAGAGISYDLAQDIGVVVDYAFRDVKEFPQPNHIFTIKLGFY